MDDFYDTKEKCLNRDKRNTNNRYKTFYQTHFTCGDYGQFIDNRCYKVLSDKFKKYENNSLTWSKYKDLSEDSVYNTFQYLFNKFKKGIFVKILNNKVVTFLPFSNYNYVNEFPEINFTDKWPDIFNLSKYVTEKSGFKYVKKKVNKYQNEWYANDSLIRYEYPINEGDSGVHQIHHMFTELCEKREVPDIEFFVNKRDFPLLKKNLTEPYENIFGKDCSLLSHCYEKYCPILSMNSNDRYADITIPTWEDWSRVNTDKFFPKPCHNFNYKFPIKWEDKKEVAVFRGSSTGISSDIIKNKRFKLAKMNNPLLDVGITKYNLRPRFHRNNDKLYLSTTDIEELDISLKDELSPEQQSEYKYIINVEGHSVAYRLSLELGMGSVILLVECENKLWYSDKLKPYIHYVPVKSDLSDLINQIEWCKSNDDKCKEIVDNAKRFYDQYLQKNGIFDHIQKVLHNLKEVTGTYEYICHNRIENVITTKTNYLVDYEGDIEFEHKLQTKNSTIYLSKDCKIIKKNGVCKEIVNSGYIGLNYINKLDNSQFYKTYGCTTSEIYVENIIGFPFNLWIKKHFNLTRYFEIIKKVCYALNIAQEKFNFIHFDLYPWNIMIRLGDSSPVIIDYGKSMVNDELILEMVKPCRFHDVITTRLIKV